MKRILADSTVRGWQLFRYAKSQPDGSIVTLQNYYIRHLGTETCTHTARLKDAPAAVKKAAGLDVQRQRRSTATVQEVKIKQLLDLVIEDYKVSDKKSLGTTMGKIRNGMVPFFGEMRANKLDSKAMVPCSPPGCPGRDGQNGPPVPTGRGS